MSLETALSRTQREPLAENNSSSDLLSPGGAQSREYARSATQEISLDRAQTSLDITAAGSGPAGATPGPALSELSWRDFDRAANAGIFGRNNNSTLEKAAQVLIQARERIAAEANPETKAALERNLSEHLAQLDREFRERSEHSKGRGLAEYLTRQFHGEERQMVLKAFGPDAKAYAIALKDAINTDQPQAALRLLRDLRDRPEILDQVRHSFSRSAAGPNSLDYQVDKFFNDRVPEKRLRQEIRDEVRAIMRPDSTPTVQPAKPAEPALATKPEAPSPAAHAEQRQDNAAAIQERKVVAQKGDSLWSIARRELSRDGREPTNHEINILVHKIYEENRAKMPQGMNALKLGVELTLP